MTHQESCMSSGGKELAVAGLLSAEQLQLATERSGIGWWVVAEGYGQLAWTPRVQQMFGISDEIQSTINDFFDGLHPEDRDRVEAAYAAAADPERRALYDVEYRTVGKEDRAIRWVAAKGRGIFDETGRCVRMTGIAIDITARMQLQEERQEHERETAQLREQFIAVLGHDLKTPLASIASATRLIARNPEHAGKMVAQIEQRVARMSELIKNLLDFARGRLGGGFITLRDSDAPLDPVLLQVIDELVDLHPEHAIASDIRLTEPVRCDRLRIGQLLSNLLGNAVVYGEPSGPIDVNATSEGGRFELSVTNHGETIDASEIDKLFQPYFRSGSKDDGPEGLGLGLYICAEIAKAHGGTITVQSGDGKTCFTVEFPCNALPAESA